MTHTADREQVAQIAAQIGSSLMPDSTQWRNRFTVNSTSSSAVYTVAQRRTDAVWGCSCRGWTHYRRCKHLAEILGRLAVLAEQSQADLDESALAILRSARTAYLDLDESIRVASPVPKAARYLDL
jgi:hypothetical protein